jgi:hypothetical protein
LSLLFHDNHTVSRFMQHLFVHNYTRIVTTRDANKAVAHKWMQHTEGITDKARRYVMSKRG